MQIKLSTYILLLLGGIALLTGIAVLLAITSSTKPQPTCDSGYSTQVENDVTYKTYVPALDNCKK